MPTTLGREILRDALPEKYKGYADRVWDKGTVEEALTGIIKDYPDQYVDILQGLNNVGRRVVTGYGGEAGISLKDFKKSAAIKKLQSTIQNAFRAIYNSDALTEEEKEKKIHDLNRKVFQKAQDIILKDHKERNTALASQIGSGVRGNPSQLMQLFLGNVAIKDPSNRPVPFTFAEDYSSAVSPLTYWLGASSSRLGYIKVQFATADAGYLSKQIANATHSTPVSTEDCGTTTAGIPVKATSSDNLGSVLLRPYKGFKAGDVVTKDLLEQADDDDEIIVRSPVTCQAKGGICAKCAGKQADGKFPIVGDYLALTAAKAFSEPLTQAAVGCLHPDTRVRMADGTVKPMKDIQVGDYVLGADEDGRTFPAEVTFVFDKGVVPMYKTVYASTRTGDKGTIAELMSTTNHKVLQVTCRQYTISKLVGKGPKPLEAGIEGNHVQAVTAGPPLDPFVGVDYDEAFLMGLLSGATDILYQHKLFGNIPDAEFIKGIRDRLRPLGVELTSSHLGGTFQEYTDKWSCLLGRERHLPEDYTRWSTATAVEFMEGFVMAGSHINHDKKPYGVRLNVHNQDMADNISYLLKRHFGIYNSGYESRSKVLFLYNKKEIYKLLIQLKLFSNKGVRAARLITSIENECMDIPSLLFRVSQEYVGDMPALDLEVNTKDHLFVLENGLVVSNSKHAGGVGAAGDDDDTPEGFEAISQMLTLPSTFKAKAVLAPKQGKITAIEDAPQGGQFIYIDNAKAAYVPSVRKITAKVGDEVNPGDVLTNGIPNPKEITEYKGIGEGRDYFAKMFSKLLKDAGAGTTRRNVETFTRAFVNKVRITSPYGYKGYMPGDIVDFDSVMYSWKPRSTSTVMKPSDAVGKYLEEPVLTYTVGTKITKPMADTLKKYNYTDIRVDNDPPPWEPELVRSQAFMQNDKDWMARLTGERIQQSLFDAAQQGMEAPYNSQSMFTKVVLTPYRVDEATGVAGKE